MILAFRRQQQGGSLSLRLTWCTEWVLERIAKATQRNPVSKKEKRNDWGSGGADRERI